MNFCIIQRIQVNEHLDVKLILYALKSTLYGEFRLDYMKFTSVVYYALFTSSSTVCDLAAPAISLFAMCLYMCRRLVDFSICLKGKNHEKLPCSSEIVLCSTCGISFFMDV